MSITTDQKVIFAVNGNNLPLLRERIEAGGNINYMDERYGSVLTAAIRVANEEILQYLIDNGVELNAQNSHGIVPLEMALRLNNSNIIKKLVWSGAKLGGKPKRRNIELLESCLKTS